MVGTLGVGHGILALLDEWDDDLGTGRGSAP